MKLKNCEKILHNTSLPNACMLRIKATYQAARNIGCRNKTPQQKAQAERLEPVCVKALDRGSGNWM